MVTYSPNKKLCKCPERKVRLAGKRSFGPVVSWPVRWKRRSLIGTRQILVLSGGFFQQLSARLTAQLEVNAIAFDPSGKAIASVKVL